MSDPAQLDCVRSCLIINLKSASHLLNANFAIIMTITFGDCRKQLARLADGINEDGPQHDWLRLCGVHRKGWV